MPKKDLPEYVVYRVVDQFKYWFNDSNPQLIKTGMYYWDARALMRELQKSPDIPKSPGGYPQTLYKLCRLDEWNKHQQTQLF